MAHHTEDVWKEFHKRLKQFILLKIRRKEDAEDILQEVFIRIHNKIDTLKDSQKLESWIYQITRNAIIDYYRSRKEASELPDSLAEEEAFEDEAAKKISPSVHRMIDELPSIYKEALMLNEYGGIPQNKIAEHLGLSVTGAKSRVQRARKHLKGMLLDCCNFELDRFGNIIDYSERKTCCKK